MANPEDKIDLATGACPCCGRPVIQTREPVPVEQLMEEQGITGPQGLDIFKRIGSGWTDADDVILEIVT
jgi:hypothetical protein